MSKTDYLMNTLERSQAFITHREEINLKFANEVIDWSFSKNIMDYEAAQRLIKCEAVWIHPVA